MTVKAGSGLVLLDVSRRETAKFLRGRHVSETRRCASLSVLLRVLGGAFYETVEVRFSFSGIFSVDDEQGEGNEVECD